MTSAVTRRSRDFPDVDEQAVRIQIDRSGRQTVLGYHVSAVFWLLFGSLAAIVASIKLHNPDFLSEWSWLTFGRVRPVHLNTMVYGWSSMAGIGTLLWLQVRLCKVALPSRFVLPTTVGVWNVAVAWGVIEPLAGNSTGVECRHEGVARTA
ncbi:MAG: cbb3-type cytochrome c oxidase subunit I [Bryobacteraceae bacterium]